MSSLSPRVGSNDSQSRKTISAVIACYRDAPAVPEMYERLKAVFEQLGVRYEIIFVNDSSPDDAQDVLAEIAARDKHVVVVTLVRGGQNTSLGSTSTPEATSRM